MTSRNEASARRIGTATTGKGDEAEGGSKYENQQCAKYNAKENVSISKKWDVYLWFIGKYIPA